MAMRSGEISSSLYDQASKTLEWAMTCLDIADVIYDTSQANTGRVVSYNLGLNVRPTIEEQREQIKQKLKMYINQLAISEDDAADVPTAAAVAQLLSDIERIEAARFLAAFQKLVKTQTFMSKIVTNAGQNQQPCQTPNIRQLGKIVKTVSFDIVSCMKLTFWPSVAAEWKTRDRLWPRQSVIDGIVDKGAHLVGRHRLETFVFRCRNGTRSLPVSSSTLRLLRF